LILLFIELRNQSETGGFWTSVYLFYFHYNIIATVCVKSTIYIYCNVQNHRTVYGKICKICQLSLETMECGCNNWLMVPTVFFLYLFVTSGEIFHWPIRKIIAKFHFNFVYSSLQMKTRGVEVIYLFINWLIDCFELR
jgi:hypothetical protein